MTDPLDTDVLTRWIGQKLAILEQVRGLSQRQSTLIAAGDVQRLLSVLSAKQTLLNELQKVERELEPFRRQDPETRRWRSPAVREQCRQLAAHCEAALRDIVRIEQQDEAELRQRRNAAAVRLQGSHDTAEATRAYLGPPVVPPASLDLTSDT
ncbi:MAG: hypothetical protein MUF48_01810 [Pirellulaceae bacterium]|nr:hypothetical protein [Pirellulaceae bacterium]